MPGVAAGFPRTKGGCPGAREGREPAPKETPEGATQPVLRGGPAPNPEWGQLEEGAAAAALYLAL